MSRYTRRTKIEVAVLTLLFTVASLYIHIGQAGESQHGNHRTTDCAFCHTLVVDITSEAAPALDLNRYCLGCHDARKIDMNSPLTFHTATSQCTNCHSFHAPDIIVAGDRTFKYRFDRNSRQRTLCVSCHGKGENPNLISEGHRRAANLYHADYEILAGLTPSQACMLCHSENSNLDPQVTSGLQVPQFPNHSSHPVSIKVVPGKGEPGNKIKFVIDQRLRLFDGSLECQTCHSLSAMTPDRLANFPNTTEMCNGCHLLN